VTDGYISKSMFKILDRKDHDLASRLLDMQARALKDWMPLLIPDRGSHAGLLHLINVGRNVDKMIPAAKAEELSAGEMFLLLAAVLLHDIGRILPGSGKPMCALQPCKQLSKPFPCIDSDWDHHQKSDNIIQQSGLELGLPDDMTVRYCALLAYCHRLAMPPRKDQLTEFGEACTLREGKRPEFRNTSIEPLGSVRIPLLAAVLRIADEAENHWTRALNERWFRLFEANQGNLGKAFRRRVEDVEFCHAGECIVMHLADLPESDELERFAMLAAQIKSVLGGWNKDLRPLDIQFSDVFYEVRGRLHRFETKAGKTKASVVDGPMVDVLAADRDQIRILVDALARLSNATMGHPDFPWASVEAEVGRPLKDRDKWLIEKMGDWAPDQNEGERERSRCAAEDRSGGVPVRALHHFTGAAQSGQEHSGRLLDRSGIN